MNCKEFARYACVGASDCCKRIQAAQDSDRHGVTYGIPPALNPRFTGSRNGTHAMLLPPARVKPAGKATLLRDLAPPTAEALRRHAERFGTDCVAETAREHGVDLKVEKLANAPKRRRRTSDELRTEVLELHARGLVPAAMADAVNVADRRVAEILRGAAAA